MPDSEHPVEATEHHHHPVVESGGDIDSQLIATVAFAGTFTVVAIVLFVQAADNMMGATERQKKASASIELANYRNDQGTKLAGYRWVDKGEGLVSMPIEEAVKRTAAEGFRQWASQAQAAEDGDEPHDHGAGEAAAEGEGGAAASEEEPEEAGEEEQAQPEAPKLKAPKPKAPKPKAPTPKAPKSPKTPAPKAPAPKAPQEDPYG